MGVSAREIREALDGLYREVNQAPRGFVPPIAAVDDMILATRELAARLRAERKEARKR